MRVSARAADNAPPLSDSLLHAVDPDGPATPALRIFNDPGKTAATPLPALPENVVPPTPQPPADLTTIQNADIVRKSGPAAAPQSVTPGSIVQFPVIEKIRTDSVNPGIAPTAPEPAPDVAASLASPAKRMPSSSKRALGKKPQTQNPGNQPGRAAGPKMPAVPPAAVLAEPLADPHTASSTDPLASQLLSPDKKALVKAIEAVSNGLRPPSTLRGSEPPPAAPIAAPDAPLVRTPAENVNQQNVEALSTTHHFVANEKGFFSLVFQPGTMMTDDHVLTLQTGVLPVLSRHPAWHLQITAYASAVNSEPLNARRIALSRVLSIRGWLIDKGVAAKRLDIRTFGPDARHVPPDAADLVFTDDGKIP